MTIKSKPRTQWIINVFDGIDKLGKTTGINTIRKIIESKHPDMKVELIQNPTPEQREILAKKLTDTPILDSAIYSAFITKNWVDYREKNYVGDLARSGKTHVVLIDRWYSSTFAYQGVMTNTESEMVVVEHFSIDMVRDFINELSIIAEFTPEMNIYFNFFLITSNNIELVLQGQDTNTDPLSSKYKRIGFLKKVDERFHLFVELIEQLYEDIEIRLDNIHIPDNLSINVEVIDYDDFRSTLFLENLVTAYITLADTSLPDDNTSVIDKPNNKQDMTIIDIIKEEFLPAHSVFVKGDLISFLVKYITFPDDLILSDILDTLFRNDWVIVYNTGFTTLYFTVDREE